MFRTHITKITDMVTKAKDVIQNKTETEKMMDQALSKEKWGASGTLLRDIARLTFDFDEYNIIMPGVWASLDHSGKNWRQIYKGLVLLEYLIKHGCERVVDDARDHVFRIRTLTDFTHMEDAEDKGDGVRLKSKELVELLRDTKAIRRERQKARELRDKFIGISSIDSGGMGSSDMHGDGFGSRRRDDTSARRRGAGQSSRGYHDDGPSTPPVRRAGPGPSGSGSDSDSSDGFDAVIQRASKPKQDSKSKKLQIKMKKPKAAAGRSTAAAPAPARSAAPAHDDDFDPFGSASSSANKAGNDDSFDPFGSPAPAPAPARRAPAPAPVPAADDFDPFSSPAPAPAPARQSAQPPAASHSLEDDFAMLSTGFQSAPAPAPQQQQHSHDPFASSDPFVPQPAAPRQPVQQQQQQQQSAAAHDPFGDFQSAPTGGQAPAGQTSRGAGGDAWGAGLVDISAIGLSHAGHPAGTSGATAKTKSDGVAMKAAGSQPMRSGPSAPMMSSAGMSGAGGMGAGMGGMGGQQMGGMGGMGGQPMGGMGGAQPHMMHSMAGMPQGGMMPGHAGAGWSGMQPASAAGWGGQNAMSMGGVQPGMYTQQPHPGMGGMGGMGGQQMGGMGGMGGGMRR